MNFNEFYARLSAEEKQHVDTRFSEENKRHLRAKKMFANTRVARERSALSVPTEKAKRAE